MKCMSISDGKMDKSVAQQCIEAEGHYNWLHTSTCSVWESQAFVIRDIPTTFGRSLILPLYLSVSNLVCLGVCSLCTGDRN